MNSKVDSSTILSALASKHRDDIFVPECKDGPTQSVSNYLRMDAWVMNKSWVHPRMTGYEIKVSRCDFLNDNKWHLYLPLCNEFYFAAPKNLIKSAELPDKVGLIELLGKSRLVTRIKAHYRDIEFPSRLVTYILMCRSKIHGEFVPRTRGQDWQEIINDMERRKQIGLMVKGAIRDHVARITDENTKLRDKQGDYDAVIRCMKQMGIDPENFSTWNIEQRIKLAQQVFPKSLMLQIENTRTELGRLIDEIEKLKPT